MHAGNMLGFGEQKWLESPMAWRVGDIVWGLLDIIAVAGIVMRSPIGILAVVVAGTSQIVVYGLFPDAFALTEEHPAALRGMVYFHLTVLAVLGVLVYAAGAGRDSWSEQGQGPRRESRLSRETCGVPVTSVTCTAP